jgi:Domain of unknown function (DUF4384)
LARPAPPAIELSLSQPVAGDVLSIKVTTDARFSYLYVAYVQADGTVAHLVQPTGLVPSQTPPSSRLLFGDGKDGRQSFTIGAPFGHETIIAITSQSPLFNSPRPETETEREYLSALRKALIALPDGKMGPREIQAAYAGIITGPKP